ncbi:MAG: hypothetical protein ACOH1P_11885 [Lysobacter sp.]
MNRKGWPVGPRRLLCAVGLAALLAGCGFGRDSDARSGSESGQDSSLLAKGRDLALEQVCKRTAACDDEESRETIKALGEVLEQLPKEARRQLAEADMDATDNKVDNMPGVTGAGMAGLMEMARSMLEADAGQRPTSSDAVSTDAIGPDVTGPELVARLDGIPVKTGALTAAEFRSRITAIPAED